MRAIIEMLRVHACAKGFEATRDTQVASVKWNFYFLSQLTNEKSGIVSSMFQYDELLVYCALSKSAWKWLSEKFLFVKVLLTFTANVESKWEFDREN